jgi:hypothetical protein
MQFIYSHPILSGLQTLFMIWMLVDAYRRQAEQYWYYLILFVPVLGAWGYFFAVKARDFKHLHLPAFLQGRTSLDELRFRCEQTPTMAAHLELAERLTDAGSYDEALPHWEAAAKFEPDHGQVLFNRARCHAQLGQPDLARPHLERLIHKDPRWSYYAAWHALIELIDQSGDRSAALEMCQSLVKLAPTMHHQYLLAEHMLDAGQTEEAVEILERALREYEYTRGPSRRHNHRWATAAQQLLKRAAAGT